MKTPASGFSVIELLVVVAVLGILAALTLPAFNSIAGAGDLCRSGQMLGDQIVLARQEAVAKNRDLEVRFLFLTNQPFPGWKALQLWVVGEDGKPTPDGRVQKLSENMLISSSTLYSPLLTADSSRSGTTNFGSLGSCSWRGFRIRANGSLDGSVISTNNNFLTVIAGRDISKSPPDNFYAVRVNPVTGRVSHHRP